MSQRPWCLQKAILCMVSTNSVILCSHSRLCHKEDNLKKHIAQGKAEGQRFGECAQ